LKPIEVQKLFGVLGNVTGTANPAVEIKAIPLLNLDAPNPGTPRKQVPQIPPPVQTIKDNRKTDNRKNNLLNLNRASSGELLC